VPRLRGVTRQERGSGSREGRPQRPSRVVKADSFLQGQSPERSSHAQTFARSGPTREAVSTRSEESAKSA